MTRSARYRTHPTAFDRASKRTTLVAPSVRVRRPPAKMSRMAFSDQRADADAVPSPRAAVLQFALGSVIVLAVVLAAAFLAMRSVALAEARRDTAERARGLASLVEAAGLQDGILTGDRAARARLDRLVVGRVVGGSLVRVKIWAADGTILYSDAADMIGERYPLGSEERETIEEGGTQVEVSDLDKPENRLERDDGRLMEAYSRVRTPNGTPLLFEIYERFSSVSDEGYELLKRLTPALVSALLILAALQVPLAWRLARRVERAADERAVLMAYAVDASNIERGRIAADLHDGVVQDLAGLAFGLAPAAASAKRDGREAEAAMLQDTTRRLQQSVRDLRTLLVEINPQNLETVGLDAALRDLLSPLEADGIRTDLQVDGHLSTDAAAILHRVAVEAVRNAASHAAPTHVRVIVATPGGSGGRIEITDDGRGFDADRRAQAPLEGHVGLSLLAGSVERVGGRLEIESTPGQGTKVTAEVPR
jgi:two-component system, NarL family, sensor kinase